MLLFAFEINLHGVGVPRSPLCASEGGVPGPPATGAEREGHFCLLIHLEFTLNTRKSVELFSLCLKFNPQVHVQQCVAFLFFSFSQKLVL